MRLPIICLDERLCQFLNGFSGLFSQPQRLYFVTILLGLMLCQESRTLTGLLRQVGSGQSLSGLSRFLSESPWSGSGVIGECQRQFGQVMAGLVQSEHARQRAAQGKRKGRHKRTVVTGYLIGDDSTIAKVRGQKMGGLGKHHSSTLDKRVVGHSLVMGLYVLLGRSCPLEPQMYRQKAVCAAEGIPFRSKVDMMEEQIQTFEPVAGTTTHVLLDSWYTAKRIWRAARQRGFLITSGLKSNRSLRIADASDPQGWRWQQVDEYAAGLTEADFQRLPYPSQDGKRLVYVHVVSTRVKKLYRCQVIFIREKLDGPTRFWASSDLQADATTLLAHIAARWDIEVLFADTKELLGLDHYQLIDALAIQRFWTLVMVAYFFLDAERDRLQRLRQTHTTIGDALRHVRQRHWCHFLDWLFDQFLSGVPPADLYQQTVAHCSLNLQG
jgi:SRSO17 transposase